MAQRSFWKGYLKLSLVTCPVAMLPAVSEAEKVRFHTLNRATGHRVESRYVDPETGEIIEDDDIAKGYEAGEDRTVVIDDDELEAVALESTRTIDIEMFVPKQSIEWVWYDRPHYLVPDDAVGTQAYVVIRSAMAATGMVGIARLVLYRRERAVMLEPRERGIVVWTLRYGDEVRDPGDYFRGLDEEAAEPEAMSLLARLIERKTRPWRPEMAGDPVQDRLLEIIAAKRKGRSRRKPKAAPAPEPSNVVNIMDALKKSIAAERSKRG